MQVRVIRFYESILKYNKAINEKHNGYDALRGKKADVIRLKMSYQANGQGSTVLRVSHSISEYAALRGNYSIFDGYKGSEEISHIDVESLSEALQSTFSDTRFGGSDARRTNLIDGFLKKGCWH